MSDPNQPTTPPGWYPDGQGGQRWWDGTAWTEHTMPLPAAQPPAAPVLPETPTVLPSSTDQTMIAPHGFQGGGQPQGGYAAQQPQTPAYGTPAPQHPAAPAWQQPGVPAQQGWAQPGGWQQPPSAPSGNGKKVAIFGGAAAVVVILLIVLFAVLGGGGGPEKVAKDFLQAQVKGESGAICELVTSGDQQDYFFDAYEVESCGEVDDALQEQIDSDPDYQQFAEEQEKLRDDLDVEIEITDSEETSDTRATVDYKTTVTYKGDDEATFDDAFGGDTTDSGTIVLKKEDGEWRVDLGESE